MSNPIPVLIPGVIYSGDNGQLFCLQCAGMMAKFTGHDRSGLKVEAMPYSDTYAWFEEFGKPMSCESGCLTYKIIPK